MGNVRSTHIKLLSDRLIEVYPDKFSTDFEKNKEALDELLTLESKSQRNRIAGFVTHTQKKILKFQGLKISYLNPNLDKRRKKRQRR